MLRCLLIILFVSAFSLSLSAQTDNGVVKVDTNMLNPGTKNRRPDSTTVQKKHEVVKDSARLALEAMPKIALRRALIFPGLGQIYNKQAWKLPFVYGGFVGIGLVFNFYQQNYSETLTELQYRLAHNDAHKNPTFDRYPTSSIITYKDFYRRNRDLSILGGVGFYALQAIDAYVKAKFARYDINSDLSLRLSPSVQTYPYNASSSVPSLKITLSL
ncbi:MAG: hypothetical protein K0S09_2750 [Sphingobacteriaceae bacterium]|jgi:hypothetical protein|nr:hypothetical protein [Sphingobacteriaceae bacterium]